MRELVANHFLHLKKTLIEYLWLNSNQNMPTCKGNDKM
jgi:hypothetical protein